MRGHGLGILGAALALGAALLGLSARAQDAGKVSYEKDVRPALESTVCVQRQEYQGKGFFMPSTEGCGDEANMSAVQKDLAKEMAEVQSKYTVLCTHLFGQVMTEAPKDGAKAGELQAKFRTLIFSDPTLMAALMPRVHAVLDENRLQCPACPGPSKAPAPRKVTLDELMPYVLKFFWPNRILPNGGVSFMVCAGINGLDTLDKPDPVLAEAAFACVNRQQEIMQMAGKMLGSVKEESGYKELKDEESKLGYLRAGLAKSLPHDDAFVAAIEARAAEVLPQYGLTCAWAEAPAAKTP